MRTIEVNLPARRYSISIEEGLLERLGDLVAAAAKGDRALLAVDAAIARSHGRVARASLEATGYEVRTCELRADERHKTLAAVTELYDAMLAARLERSSPVIALGGGVVGDVAGFAAATYLRGVPLVQVPTTLLAMVDAAIGGKTGVNHPLPAAGGEVPVLGKNLVGAFWQPVAVLADPRTLLTLEARDFRCGLAECVKHALIASPELLAFIEARADRIAARDLAVLAELIERSARVKVAIVVEDEREAGRRALLNLGHTFAHVIEPIDELDLRHGEAVAIGLCAAAWGAVERECFAESEARRTEALLARLGLPVRLPRPLDDARLIEPMAYDKKVSGGRVRLVLPAGLGRAEVADDVPVEAIARAWRAVGARAAAQAAPTERGSDPG